MIHFVTKKLDKENLESFQLSSHADKSSMCVQIKKLVANFAICKAAYVAPDVAITSLNIKV